MFAFESFSLKVLHLQVDSKHQPFNPQGKPFNLTPLICGSEGTLAVIKQETLNLVELPKYRQLICGYFESVESALRVAPELLEFNPAAIQLIHKALWMGQRLIANSSKTAFGLRVNL